MEKIKLDALNQRFADIMPELCDLGGKALSNVLTDFDSILEKSVPQPEDGTPAPMI